MKESTLIAIKTICLILVVLSPVFCIEAPFLISTVAIDDSSIQVVWRNNDINAEGFIVQRTDSSEQKFHTVFTVNSSTELSIIDTKSIRPLTTYRYQVIAFQGKVLSDTSNHLQVTTPAAKLQKGTFIVDWNCDFSKNAKLIILDSSKCESGYHIYRKDDASTTYKLLFDIVSKDPLTTDSMIAYDSSVINNRMYDYYAVVYNKADSIVLDTGSIFTYHEVYPSSVVKLSKVSEYPISYGGWSAKAGDSIILKENNSPEGKYSVINLNTPGNPKFDGYIDSSALMKFQTTTLIPVFLKFGVMNSKLCQNVIMYNNYLLVKTNSDSLNIYKLNGNTYTFQSSLSVTRMDGLFRVDNLIFYKNNFQSNWPIASYQYSILRIQSSGSLQPVEPVFINGSKSGMGGTGYTEHNIMGIMGGKYLVTGIDQYYNNLGSIANKHEIALYNIESDKMVKVSADNYLSQTINTGYYITSEEFIGLHSQSSVLELFVSSISNSRGYRIAAWNNCIYKDSTVKTNMLQNIIVDTLLKNIILVTDNKLVILKYENTASAGTKRTKLAEKNSPFVEISAINSRVVFKFLRKNSGLNDICIFDLNGRLIDKIRSNNFENVNWTPKYTTTNWFVALVKNGSNRYVSKFFINNN